jgi:hypothetical protein
MKFAATTVLLSLLASTATAMGPATRKLLSKARKLEENQQQEDEYAFLMNYNLKMVSCKAGEQIRDPETGEYENSAIVFRLCPEGCDSEAQKGCSSGHGDFVVGLQSFVQAYFEDQRDNMYFDDNFKVDEYAECREYEVENDDENENQVAYYIGPACTEDGSGVRLELFSDQYCTTAPEGVTFESLSNGWALPYESGGLVTSNCQPCAEYDNGNYALKDMCMNLYADAGKCETNMESFHYYGKQEGSCEYIESLLPKKQKSGSGAKAFGWVVFIMVVVGAFSAYAMWWKKSKLLDA